MVFARAVGIPLADVRKIALEPENVKVPLYVRLTMDHAFIAWPQRGAGNFLLMAGCPIGDWICVADLALLSLVLLVDQEDF